MSSAKINISSSNYIYSVKRPGKWRGSPKFDWYTFNVQTYPIVTKQSFFAVLTNFNFSKIAAEHMLGAFN
jgi:hypothetical protein